MGLRLSLSAAWSVPQCLVLVPTTGTFAIPLRAVFDMLRALGLGDLRFHAGDAGQLG